MSFFSPSNTYTHIRHPHSHTHHSSVPYIIYKKKYSTIDKRGGVERGVIIKTRERERTREDKLNGGKTRKSLWC